METPQERLLRSAREAAEIAAGRAEPAGIYTPVSLTLQVEAPRLTQEQIAHFVANAPKRHAEMIARWKADRKLQAILRGQSVADSD